MINLKYSQQIEVPVSEYEEICKTKVINMDFYGIGTIRLHINGRPKIVSARNDNVVIQVSSDDVPSDADFNWYNEEYHSVCRRYHEAVKAIKEEIVNSIPNSSEDLKQFLTDHNFNDDLLNKIDKASSDLKASFRGLSKYLDKPIDKDNN